MTASVLIFAATGCGSGGGTAPITPPFGAFVSPSVPVILPTPLPSASASASPSPSASPTASPTPTPSATPTPINTAYEFVVVSKDANSNFSEAKIVNGQVGSAIYRPGTRVTGYDFAGIVGSTVKNGTVPNAADNFRLSFDVPRSANGLAPGRFTFPQEPNTSDNFQAFGKTEVYTHIDANTTASWSPRGGDLIIEAVNGNRVTFRGENVRFVPIGRIAVGNFTANFRVTFTFETVSDGL